MAFEGHAEEVAIMGKEDDLFEVIVDLVGELVGGYELKQWWCMKHNGRAMWCKCTIESRVRHIRTVDAYMRWLDGPG